MNIFKTCKQCNQQKDISIFYKSYNNVYASLCKQCHYRKRTENYRLHPETRKPLKGTGFKRLNQDERIEILKDITNGMKFKEIAQKNNVNYCSLLRWKKQGQII